MKVGIISGYFNPIHVGHLDLIERSREVVDMLYVIVNNDHQRALKGSKEFMSENERVRIMSSIKGVTGAYLSVDLDRSVSNSIKVVVDTIRIMYPVDTIEFYFINGGDRHNSEIPESEMCKELKVKILDGFGEKIQSSSWLLSKE